MAERKPNRNELYMCVGESFKHNAPIGDCGDVKTLIQWLEHLYPTKDREYLERFFDNSYSNKDVCDYLYGSVGKRLVKV